MLKIDPALPLTQQLRAIRCAAGLEVGELAKATGLSFLTAAAAESGEAQAHIVALFAALGYTLLPVPTMLAGDIANYINSASEQLMRPRQGRSNDASVPALP